MDNPIWTPTSERKSSSNIMALVTRLQAAGVSGVTDFPSLHAYSVAEPEAFWHHVWEDCGLVGDDLTPSLADDPSRPLGKAFFPNARVNYAENVLNGLVSGDVMVFRGEDKVELRVSDAQLRADVAKVAGFLGELDLAPDARIAAMLPNMPQGVTAALGVSARGLIWSSCSPDFGTQGVLDRFGQIEPDVLFVCDGYFYNGKTIDVADKVSEIVAALPSLKRLVVVGYIGTADALVARINDETGTTGVTALTWDAAVSGRDETTPEFVRVPFSSPLFILFSSGTTGAPKCIVHSVGGTLLKHVTEGKYHSDIKPGDRVFYFTTLGWMMWNWLASCLASGGRLMLFDGSPFYPDSEVLWRYAEDERFTHFGTSAKYIDALKKSGTKPRERFKLDALRSVLSTGSPLVAESFDYVYEDIKQDLHLASISGGTDIIGCFVLGDPTGPVWRGEIQAKALGLDPDVVDADGNPLPTGKGELVCRNAFPSMPVGFWNDPDGKRYRGAYFERFEGLWHHGDFAEWTENGGMIIHGRSDATLNPGGVRIGTAEIYRQVEQLDEILESIVIGQQWDGDVRVVLFVILREGVTLDEDLKTRIKQRIRSGASPRHVPARIVAVADIPRTKSGKITELAVRDIVHGREINNKEALANPDALEHFRDIADLQS
jgi:acetoacetyl-CoA synthetase